MHDDEDEDSQHQPQADWLTKVGYEKQPTLNSNRRILGRRGAADDEPEIDRDDYIERCEKMFMEVQGDTSRFRKEGREVGEGGEVECVWEVVPDFDQFANDLLVVRFPDTSELEVTSSSDMEPAPLFVVEKEGPLEVGGRKRAAFYFGEKSDTGEQVATEFRPVKHYELTVNKRPEQGIKELLIFFEEGKPEATICPAFATIKVQDLSKADPTQKLKPIHLAHRGLMDEEEEARREKLYVLLPNGESTEAERAGADDDDDDDDDDEDDDL